MSIEFNCDCGRYYKVDDKLAGKRAKCKQCGQTMTVPTPDQVELLEEDFSSPPEEYGVQNTTGVASEISPDRYNHPGHPVPGVEGQADFLERWLVGGSGGASNTARTQLDFAKYLSCYPQEIVGETYCILLGLAGGLFGHPFLFILAVIGIWMLFRNWVKQRHLFRFGCVCPAVVLADRPWTVAVFAQLSQIRQPRPAIHIVRAPMQRMTGGPPEVGMPLAAVARFYGFRDQTDFEHIEFTLVPLGISDPNTCRRIISSIPGDEWRDLDLAIARLPNHELGLHKLWHGAKNARITGSRLAINQLGVLAIVALLTIPVIGVIYRTQTGQPLKGNAPLADAQGRSRPAKRSLEDSKPSPSSSENPIPNSPPAAPRGPVWVGMQVELYSGDLWWPGVVTRVNGDRYLVHRGGVEDEWVKADQIRPTTNPNQKVPLPPPGALAKNTPAKPAPPSADAPTTLANGPTSPANPETPAPPRMPTASLPDLDQDASMKGDPSATYTAGQRVMISWGHKWWPGVVKSVESDGYHVGYDGWSEGFDETVKADRIKKP